MKKGGNVGCMHVSVNVKVHMFMSAHSCVSCDRFHAVRRDVFDFVDFARELDDQLIGLHLLPY